MHTVEGRWQRETQARDRARLRPDMNAAMVAVYDNCRIGRSLSPGASHARNCRRTIWTFHQVATC